MYLEGPVNALSTNRDASAVVVAGRNVLKIFGIVGEEGIFVERHNLRVGRHPNLNYGALDVAWSPLEDNLLATAATNGAVVVWNLGKPHKNKIETTFLVHTQAVNKVCFHCSEANYLLSGSQDASVKLFDLRKANSALSFSSGGDRIRDVKFSPHHVYMFAAADEAGNVKLWDFRMSRQAYKLFSAHCDPVLSLDFHPVSRAWIATASRDKLIKAYKLFSAHCDPVLSLDFHPVSRAWIATASRDKLIKVWDWQKEKASCEYAVQTIAPVSHVRWRPGREWHLASAALVVDFCVHVWDVRRPFIPFASFDEHKDVATGIAWRGGPHSFISSGKDGLLMQHEFADASRPADHATPVCLNFAPTGDLAWAVSNRLTSGAAANGGCAENGAVPKHSQRQITTTFDRLAGKWQHATGGPSPPRRRRGDLFRAPIRSQLNMFLQSNGPGSIIDGALSMDWFVESAKLYKLHGLPFAQLCDHNAQVASELNRPQIAQTWLMVKLLVATPDRATGGVTGLSKNSSYDTIRDDSPAQASEPQPSAVGQAAAPVSFIAAAEAAHSSDADEPPSAASGMGPRGAAADSSFFFPTAGFDYEVAALRDDFDAENWKLPREAFEPKVDLLPPLIDGQPMTNGSASPSSLLQPSSSSLDRLASEMALEPRLELRTPAVVTVAPSEGTKLVGWDGRRLVGDALHYLAETGDVQSAVSILVVLGEKGRDLVSEYTQEAWYMAYLDLLDRFELCTTAALLIKLCPLGAVSQLSQEGTSLLIGCGRCGKAARKFGQWICDQCKAPSPPCSVCQEPVRGLWVWCRSCEHGGHVQHVRAWFQKQQFCPAGCGHKCEYEQTVS